MTKETITWHEIKTRPATEEEQEQHCWLYVFECPMPDDEEEILIATKRRVNTDTCYIDGEYYLDSGKSWRDVTAWAKMPRYKGSEQE